MTTANKKLDFPSLRERILESDDLGPVPESIPEWNVEAFIKPLDGESRYKISQLAATVDHKKSNTYIAEAYVCEALVDENGEHIFEFDDRALLARKNPLVIERLYEKIVRLSGMDTDAGVDAEKK